MCARSELSPAHCSSPRIRALIGREGGIGAPLGAADPPSRPMRACLQADWDTEPTRAGAPSAEFNGVIVRAAGQRTARRVRRERARSQNLKSLERTYGCRRGSHAASGSDLEAGSTPATFTDRCCVASNAKCAPRCGVKAAGVDPPNCKANGRWLERSSSASRPGDPTPDRGLASFRALLRNTREKGADFGLPVPAVTAKRPD
jgi:hypothetical protein